MTLPFKPSGGAGGAAIGSVVTGLTAGSALYGGADGVLAQDNANWFYDASLLTLRLGPPLSWFSIDTVGFALVGNDSLGPAQIELLSNVDQQDGSYLAMTTFKGTAASPSAVVSGDFLGEYVMRGYTGGGAVTGNAVAMRGYVDGAVAVGTVPGRWELHTTTSAGSMQERLRLTSAGTTGVSSPNAASTIVMAGQVEMQGGPSLWKGSTSGLLTHAWPATITSHTLTWPADGTLNGSLRNDGAGALSWAAPITVSDVTTSRALNTTYANAYSNKGVLVMATVKCTTAILGGSATATPKVSTSATPTVSAGGPIGLNSGIAGEANAFQICFVVPAGSGQNYRLDTASANGSASLSAWFECTF